MQLLLAQLRFAGHLAVWMIIIFNVDRALRSELKGDSTVTAICTDVVTVRRLQNPEIKY